MQLKELRETLTDARLLIPAEMASMDYKLRDRRRFDHLISIARWAQKQNAMVTLDADINPGLLYATLLLELDFDPAAFPDLFDILEAIDGLKPDFRKPFTMFLDGYHYDEIAEEMEIPMGTVKSRIFHARKKLSSALVDFA